MNCGDIRQITENECFKEKQSAVVCNNLTNTAL